MATQVGSGIRRRSNDRTIFDVSVGALGTGGARQCGRGNARVQRGPGAWSRVERTGRWRGANGVARILVPSVRIRVPAVLPVLLVRGRAIPVLGRPVAPPVALCAHAGRPSDVRGMASAGARAHEDGGRGTQLSSMATVLVIDDERS